MVINAAIMVINAAIIVINAALSDASQVTKATILQGAVFGVPKEKDLRLRRITFLHRNDVSKLKSILIWEKHFDDRFLNKKGKLTRLIINKLPFPSILSDTPSGLDTEETRN